MESVENRTRETKDAILEYTFYKNSNSSFSSIFKKLNIIYISIDHKDSKILKHSVQNKILEENFERNIL